MAKIHTKTGATEQIIICIRDAVNKAQNGHQNIAPVMQELKVTYNQLDDDVKVKFQKEFIHCLKLALQVLNREPAVERVVEFIAKFAAQFAKIEPEDDNELDEDEEEEDNFYEFILNFILENADAAEKAVRFRCCQMVKLLLQSVPREAALDEDLVEKITKTMLLRINDIVPCVRAQAARSLIRLQQPMNKRCPILKEYLFFMRYDQSADVRAAVLSSITMSSRSLPSIILRVRDAKESVRKLAFQVLCQKISVKALSQDQQLHLLEQGLYDQSEAVRKVVTSQLLQSWLATFQGSKLLLMKNLDVIGSTEITCKAIVALFDLSNVKDLVEEMRLLNDKNLIEYTKLTAESVTYWFLLCDYIQEKGADVEHYLDKVLPALVNLCDYVEEYFNKYIIAIENTDVTDENALEKEFIAEQLLKIACACNLSDEAGRNKLKKLVHKLMLDVNVQHYPCIVPPLALCLKVLYDDAEERVSVAAEVMQEIREIREDVGSQLTEEDIQNFNLKLAKLRVAENEAEEALEEQIRLKKFDEAANIQSHLDKLRAEVKEIDEAKAPRSQSSSEYEIKSDPATLLKCLQIIKVVAQSMPLPFYIKNKKGHSRPRKLHPTVIELVQSLILPAVTCPLPAVRNVAVSCLGTCCILSYDLALQHLPLFLQVLQADVTPVRINALESITDILRIYGTEAFANSKVQEEEPQEYIENPEERELEKEENYVTSMIMQKMVEMLDEDNEEIRLSATNCLIMILVSGRVFSPTIFAKLVIMWYNPTIQDDHKTINKITTFLDFYPYMLRSSQECVQEAFLPILHTIIDAPNTSPLSSVKIGNVAKLLVCLTKPSIIRDTKHGEPVPWLDDFSAHDEMAIQLCTEILHFPQSAFVLTMCRLFEMLELSSNPQTLKDLSVYCQQMLEKVTNKTALKLVQKFEITVENLLSLTNGNDNNFTDADKENVYSKENIEMANKNVYSKNKTPTKYVEGNGIPFEEINH